MAALVPAPAGAGAARLVQQLRDVGPRLLRWHRWRRRGDPGRRGRLLHRARVACARHLPCVRGLSCRAGRRAAALQRQPGQADLWGACLGIQAGRPHPRHLDAHTAVRADVAPADPRGHACRTLQPRPLGGPPGRPRHRRRACRPRGWRGTLRLPAELRSHRHRAGYVPLQRRHHDDRGVVAGCSRPDLRRRPLGRPHERLPSSGGGPRRLGRPRCRRSGGQGERVGARPGYPRQPRCPARRHARPPCGICGLRYGGAVPGAGADLSAIHEPAVHPTPLTGGAYCAS